MTTYGDKEEGRREVGLADGRADGWVGRRAFVKKNMPCPLSQKKSRVTSRRNEVYLHD